MQRTKSQIIFHALGLIFSVAPVTLATLSYFPLWQSRGEGHVISGIALLLIILGFLPAIRIIMAKLKSPSAVLLWFIIFAMFFALSRIADEITVIAFFGFLGNLIGSVFFRLSKKHK